MKSAEGLRDHLGRLADAAPPAPNIDRTLIRRAARRRLLRAGVVGLASFAVLSGAIGYAAVNRPTNVRLVAGPSEPSVLEQPQAPPADVQARPDVGPAGHIAYIRDGALYVADLDDPGSPRRLTDLDMLRDPAWSPDGTMLAVERFHSDGWQALYVVAPADGSYREVLRTRPYDGVDGVSQDSFPAWVNDREIELWMATGDFQYLRLTAVTTDGRARAPATPSRSYYQDREPRSGRTAFIGPDPPLGIEQTGLGVKQSGLFVTDGDAEVTRLTADATTGVVEWSPDGQAIAFTRKRVNNGRLALDVCIFPALGSHQPFCPTARSGDGDPPTNRYLPTNGMPTWSPDGRFLAFTHDPDGLDVGKPMRIRVMTAEGEQVMDLGEGEAPAWSPQ